jgi:GST-like protein
MTNRYILYSAVGSGGVAVEAALTLIGAPYDLVEAPTFEDDQAAGDRVLATNPMRQVPALVTPAGETLTESAAILVWLAEQHPQASLAPIAGEAGRGAFLRWMSFVSAAVYSLYWIKDDPTRLVAGPAAHREMDEKIQDRISACWAIMEAQVTPGRYILGDEITMLDLYVAVVSRFRPRRQRFYEAAPRMGEAVRRVDADPRLAALWAERYPFFDGWDRL